MNLRDLAERVRLGTVALVLLLVVGVGAATWKIWGYTHPPVRVLDASHAKAFEAANHAYAAGDFATAIRGYSDLTRDVAHEELYYNLGNAYFGAGELGRAIYWYERALELDPSWDAARANLAKAHEYVRASLPEDEFRGGARDQWQVRLARRFTSEQLELVFLLAYVALFALLIVVRYVPGGAGRTSLVVGSVLVGVFALGSGLMLANKIRVTERYHYAITLPAKLPLRVGPHDDASSEAAVHAGLRVQVLHVDAEDWAKIRLENGYDAYVKATDLGLLD